MGDDGEVALQVANAAMLNLEHHEKICGERYEQIIKNMDKSEQDRKELRAAMSAGHDRLFSRMWTIMFSMMMTLTACAGTLGLMLLAYIQSR